MEECLICEESSPTTARGRTHARDHASRLEDQCIQIREGALAIMMHEKTGLVITMTDQERCLTVLNALEDDICFEHNGNDMTAQDLVDILAEHPDRIHLFECADALLEDPETSEVLRLALAAPICNVVKYGRTVYLEKSFRSDGRKPFVFSGAVILCITKKAGAIPWFKKVRDHVAEARLDITPEAIQGVLLKADVSDVSAFNPDAVWEVFDRLLSTHDSDFARRKHIRVLNRFCLTGVPDMWLRRPEEIDDF